MKAFHISDVLSITTGRLVIGGVYEILNFMTGDNLMTRQLPRAMKDCFPYLERQFPELCPPRINDALSALDALMEEDDDRELRAHKINLWVSLLVQGRYGVGAKEFYDVAVVPEDEYAAQDPIAEMESMLRPDQEMIVIQPEIEQ